MGREKEFNINVKPRDVIADVGDMTPNTGFAYLKFWMHHALHGEPLPPRDCRKPPAEWDEWFRDKLGMKNVRTWRNARDELLELGKIRRTDDGRYFIGRTMRDVEKKRGGDPSRWGSDEEDDGQGALALEGVHWAQVPGGKPVEPAGELPTSTEVRDNIGQTSRDVVPIRLPKSLIVRPTRCVSSSPSRFDHEVVAVISTVAARARAFGIALARGDPAIAQA